MEIDEIKIKLTGLACVQTAPQKGKLYDLTISNVEIRDKKEIPNDDGTETHIYTARLRPESELNLIRENELVLAKPKKGSQSQALRMAIMELWKEQFQGQIDFEEFYKSEMSKMIELYKNKLV